MINDFKNNMKGKNKNKCNKNKQFNSQLNKNINNKNIFTINKKNNKFSAFFQIFSMGKSPNNKN